MRRAQTAAVLLLAGCGAASERDVHALYASLQVEEARVAAAEHAILGGEPAACEDACAASAAARSIADRIAETDARIRAEHAERVCTACRSAP